MTTSEAKRWVQHYFKHFDELQSDEIFTVVEDLCGCFDPLPKSLQEEYRGATTYHELWLELQTDRIIEIDDPTEWATPLYPIYVKDQAARRAEPPTNTGFFTWLATMVGEEMTIEALGEHRS